MFSLFRFQWHREYLGLLASMAIFFSFGFFHLAKFETVDEHFWKYKRIPQYWDGVSRIAHLDISGVKKTYINDKPGVTVAMLSGVGLLFEPHPETHRVQNNTLTIYDSSRTESINMALRFPMLLAGVFSFPLFFWLVFSIFRKRAEKSGHEARDASIYGRRVALLFVIVLSVSPVLIGMSQILNPDALLWICMPASILSYFALLETKEKRFLWLTGALTGLALLSKYTANILWLLYLIIFLGYALFYSDEIGEAKKFLQDRLREYVIIVISALVVFSIGMPAVFVKSKYLLNGTFLSPAMKPLLIPVLISLLLLFVDAWVLNGRIFQALLKYNRLWRSILATSVAVFCLTMFLGVFANIASGGKWISLDDVKEEVYVDGDLAFPRFDGDILPIRIIKETVTELQMLPFSIVPLELAFVLLGWLLLIFRKKYREYDFYIWFPGVLLLVFVFGALVSGVFLNYRYAIVMYPFFALMSVIVVIYGIEWASKRYQNVSWSTMYLISIGALVACGLIALFNIKPFYLNYTSNLLPKEYVLVDAWGYGEYEAAQYLNNLPDAENVVVWSDRSALCQFIVGKCIRDYKIDLSKTVPDYFVFSRRGSLRHKFEWRDASIAKRSNLDYYTDDVLNNPEWELFIGGREKNWVKVVKSAEIN